MKKLLKEIDLFRDAKGYKTSIALIIFNDESGMLVENPFLVNSTWILDFDSISELKEKIRIN
jgi:hypothetical protein